MSEPNHRDHPPGYDKSRISIAWVTTIALLTIALITTFAIVINELFVVSKEQLVYEQVLGKDSSALRDLRAREEEELGSYKLLDAEKGSYQIPVERAIQIMADSAYQQQLKDGQN